MLQLKTINGASIDISGLTEESSLAMIDRVQQTLVSTPIKTPKLDQTIDISTTFVRGGEGKTVVMLHGFDSSCMEFRRLMPLLEPSYEVIVPDLLGFGFTQRPEGLPISQLTIGQHLAAFIQSQVNEPIILVGASMGGAAAMDFALAYPELVEKLVLLDPVGWQPGGKMGKFLIPPLGYLATSFLANPTVRQKISENAYSDRSYASKDAQAVAALHLKYPGWRQGLISFTRNNGYGSFREKMTQLAMPTLLLWGRDDRILGVKDTEKIAAAIPNCRLEWIENCGHVPHLEKSDLTAQLMLDAIAALSPVA